MAPQLNFNHVALSIPNLQAAIEFYSKAFGFKHIRSPKTHDRKLMPKGVIFPIYGPALQTVKVAYMSCGNGVGFELFEFIDPTPLEHDPVPEGATFHYRKGFYHCAVTVESVPETVELVKSLGGKLHGEIVTLNEEMNDQAAYVSDPWGNMTELLTLSFERLLANTAG